MRATGKIFLFLFLITIIVTCDSFKPKKSSNNVWSSNDPLSIPLRQRYQKFQRENLVKNGSFETGKIYVTGDTLLSYQLVGWENIGKNIEWLNLRNDSSISRINIYDSLCALKITRNILDEVEEYGNGVMSDFIKVIPGNYELSMYLKLKNILPYTKRRGTRLNDAVNIRLLYFDKNKLPIKSNQFDPRLNSFIDNSFKSLDLCNLWKIDSIDWIKFYGKSTYNHFIDGDIPENTSYVKIYIGLKGTGTLYVDRVNFRYTHKNFSLQEQLIEYIDSTLSPYHLIIPTPKKIKALGTLEIFDDDKTNQVIPIVIPKNPEKNLIHAAKLLKTKINDILELSLAGKSVKINPTIIDTISAENLLEYKIVFSIGKSVLYQKFNEILPVHELHDKSQSYLVYSNSDLSNTVFLYSDSPVGNFYATATAIQLFDANRACFYKANIIDFPDFTERAYMINLLSAKEKNTSIHYIDRISELKINGVYFGIESNKKEIASAVKIIENVPENLISPYALLYDDLDFGKSKLSSKKYEDTKNNINKLYNLGIKNIALHNLPQNTDLNTICSNKTECMDLITETFGLYNYITSWKTLNFPSRRLILFPYWNNSENIINSEGVAEWYYTLMRQSISARNSYFFCGASEFSLKTNIFDFYKIYHITNQKPYFFDNSIQCTKIINECKSNFKNYLGKINTYSIFQPYSNTNFHTTKNKDIQPNEVLFNFEVNNELDFIRLATAADFAWNSSSYNPNNSIRNVLMSYYGCQGAMAMLKFDNSYMNLLRHLMEYKKSDKKKISRKDISQLEMLKKNLERVGELVNLNSEIYLELAQLYNSIEKEFITLE